MSEKKADIKCEKCGGDARTGQLYCGHCGAKLAS
jgi:Zn finger protein HypA/HybF involved in hydrogenase expression